MKVLFRTGPMMARRKTAFVAVLGSLLAPAWAQLSLSSLPSNCYYTSTVIFGGQSGFQTFSSMNSPIFSNPSSTVNTESSARPTQDPSSSTSVGAIILSSTNSPTSSSSVPTPLPSQPFFIQAVDATAKAKRDIRYATFVNGFATLVDVKGDGSLFVLSADGYLLNGDFFVGPAAPCSDGQSCSSVLTRAATFPDPNINEWNNWTVNSSTVSFGDARFCVGAEDNLFLVFSDGAGSDCTEVLLVPDLAPASTISSSTTASSSMTSSVSSLDLTTTTAIETLSSSARSTSAIPSSATIPPLSSGPSSVVAPSLSSFTTESGLTSSSRTTATPVLPATPSTSSESAYPTTTPSASTTQPISSVSSSTQGTPSSPRPPSSSSSSASATLSSSRSSSSTIPPTSSSSVVLTSNTSSSSSTSRLSSPSALPPPAVTSSSISASTSTLTSHSSSFTSHSSSSSSSTSTTRSFSSMTSSTSPSASPILPGKRGLAYSNVNLTYYYPPPTQVSWTYNYYYAPNSSTSRGIFPGTPSYPIRFIPLLFNDDSSLTSEWPPTATFAIEEYGADALFSFNEPDLCVPGSACMSVARAISAYNRSMQPFATSHPQVKLVAPSITNAGSGFIWLREFLGNATLLNLKIDVINIHWYASPYSMDYFIEYMQQAREIAGNKPIWITEYGMDRLDYYEPHVLQFIRNSTYWCDQQGYIERYAWFGNYVNNLVNSAGTALSPRGQLWHNYFASGYVYGWPPRLAGGSVGPAKAVKGEELVEEEGRRKEGKVNAKAEGKGEVEGEGSSWSRGWFVDRLWWKQDGHMDGK